MCDSESDMTVGEHGYASYYANGQLLGRLYHLLKLAHVYFCMLDYIRDKAGPIFLCYNWCANESIY